MTAMTSEVSIPLPTGEFLQANLDGPESSLIVFAHGSGSSRRSPRNQQVAQVLNNGGLRTLLLDLLTEQEEQRDLITASHRFDIDLLGNRVGRVLDWVVDELDPPSIGLFGASTGAAAALVAAATRPMSVAAVVSRGGRPDLAMSSLEDVRAPTLLIVGGRDTTVLEMNRKALEKLSEESRLEVVEGATHLFEEPGALDQVADLAADWFQRHLGPFT